MVKALRIVIEEFKRGTVAKPNRRGSGMHRRAAEIREVETIHKTLNVVLAEIDKLAPSVPVPAASMNCPHCGYAVGHADSCEYERFKPAAGSPAPSAIEPWVVGQCEDGKPHHCARCGNTFECLTPADDAALAQMIHVSELEALRANWTHLGAPDLALELDAIIARVKGVMPSDSEQFGTVSSAIAGEKHPAENTSRVDRPADAPTTNETETDTRVDGVPSDRPMGSTASSNKAK